jgi:CheY-like chemotaxis protein
MDTEEKNKLIAIVDDDDLMRNALQGLLKSVGLPARAFASAEEFLQSGQQRQTACLIADIRMPGMSGLELRRTLQNSNHLYHGTRRHKNANAGDESRGSGVPRKAFRRRSPARECASGSAEWGPIRKLVWTQGAFLCKRFKTFKFLISADSSRL